MGIKIGIIGATGYVGEELFRILKAHPQAEITNIISKSFAGQTISSVYGSHRFIQDQPLTDLNVETISKECDVVFTALPHGESIKIVPALMQAGVKVIDMSGDFRYKDPAVYEAWYGIHHTEPGLLSSAVYGLPELYGEAVKKTGLVANPGCYTSASILALYPLLSQGLISPKGIVVDAKSGVTGAGRTTKLPFSFCETQDNFKAYGVTTHRHTSEIEQELSIAAKEPVALCFTPHLLPVKRGILATIYADLLVPDEEAFGAAYAKFYQNAPFTHVLPVGELPELKHVVGSNNCAIGFKLDFRLGKVIVISCIDNLIKGAAGQAVQNMNLMFGLPETAGLSQTAWYL